MDDERRQGGDTGGTQRRSPESSGAPRRRPPVARLQILASREAVCELLEVTPRTVQRRVHAGDIERVEGDERPLYILNDTRWMRGQLARARWGVSPGGDIVDVVVATTMDHTSPPSTAALVAALSTSSDHMRAELTELAKRVASLEEGEADSAGAGAYHGSHQSEGDGGGTESDAGTSEARARASGLTGWRAVCVALLVRLKLLLDAIINSLRGRS